MTQPAADNDDSWKTPELRAAEEHLVEIEAETREIVTRTEEQLAAMPPGEDPATPEAIAAWQNEASKPDATAEMRALKRKVDAGELTWEAIVRGEVYDHPAVKAALAPMFSQLSEVYHEFEEGHTLEEVLEAHGADDLLDDSSYPAPAGADEGDELDDADDDDFGGSIYDR